MIVCLVLSLSLISSPPLSHPLSLPQDSVRKQVGKFKFIHSRNVPRPQAKFRDQVDNSNNPFVPRLKEKPNARVPLPDGEQETRHVDKSRDCHVTTVYERLANPSSLSALIANAKEWAGSEERLAHPYKYELENFEPTAEQLQLREPQVRGRGGRGCFGGLVLGDEFFCFLQLPGSNEDTPLTYVDSLAQLEALRDELKSVREFAIDLEVTADHTY